MNASTFGAPSSQSQSQSQSQNQTTANPSAGGSASTSSSFGGLGLGSTFTHFRSQLLVPPLAAPQSTPDQTESASSRRGVGGPAVGGGGSAAAAQATGAKASDSDGSAESRGGITRDSLYDMADRFSAWPSEKIEKAKRLRDQFLSKV